MLNYTKLWLLLERKGMKKTDLKQVISSATLAKLGKNEPISSTVIEKICGFLNCQPGDMMEYINEEQMKETAQAIDMMNRALIEQIKAKGVTEEQYMSMLSQIMPEMIKSIYNGQNVMSDIYDQAIADQLGENE